MSQWAEIQYLHRTEGVAKKAIARRLGIDVKTVRRALSKVLAPMKRAPAKRPPALDACRDKIVKWLRAERHLTAKRIRTLLLPQTGPIAPRTVRLDRDRCFSI